MPDHPIERARILGIRAMADEGWEWSASSRRYRGPDGKYLSAADSIDLRNDFADRQRTLAAELASKLASDELTVQEWERQMRSAVKSTYGTEYLFGRGGRNAMAVDERPALAALIKEQHDFLNRFAADVADGKLSAAQIAARSQLYFAGAVQAYERGRVAAYAGLHLSTYPGDGTQACKSRCRCHLDISEDGDSYRVFWRLNPAAEHCESCTGLASSWSPLVVAKEAAA